MIKSLINYLTNVPIRISNGMEPDKAFGWHDLGVLDTVAPLGRIEIGLARIKLSSV